MRSIRSIKIAILSAVMAATFVGFSVTDVNGQNTNVQYRQWQNAQAKAEREYRDYLRTRSARDYRQWQNSLAKAQREYAEYQRSNNQWNANNIYSNVNSNYNRRYRVYNNGSYYDTDNRGAELLRQAVRNGYSQGYQRGQADRRNRGRYNYGGDSMYRSGSYGYQSYVARNQYQHYFQQGFQRGYEDGYYSRNRYGTRSGNAISILGSVLNTILNITDDN